MNKLTRILEKQAVKLLKDKSIKALIKYYIKTAKENQNLTLKIKTDLDFFNAAILMESFKNKSWFETTYERERKELHDLWPALSYQERNKLINLKISELKKRTRSFKSVNGTTIWIAFFDELLNTLYDKEMNIFDLDQYFNLYKDYAKRMIKTESYGIMPYAGAYIDIKVLRVLDNQVIFYYDALKSIYLIKEEQGILVLKKLGLKSDYHFTPEDCPLMINIITELELEHTTELIDVLLTSSLMSDKTKKALTVLRRKMK
jgi:hypothetical protein